MSTGSSALTLPEDSIEVPRGSSRTLEISITDLDGNIVDITGARVVMTLKEDVRDSALDCIFVKDTNDPLEAVITNPTGGIVEISIIPSDTQNLDPGFEYVYDVWLVQATGDRFQVVGPAVFKVTDSVTQIPL